MLEYYDMLFLEGDTCNAGERVLAAWMALNPDFSRHGLQRLPRVSRALQGWRRADPGTTRPPIPWSATCLICLSLAQSGQVEAAVAVLVMFLAYLRPSELLALRNEDVIPASSPAGHVALLLHPSSRLEVSKVGLSDESLLLDSRDVPLLGKMLLALRRGRPGNWLCQHSYDELKRIFHDVQVSLLFPGFPYCLYQLRHGGASHDRLHRHRELLEVQRRGRWSSVSTLRRYESHALVQQQEQRLGAVLQSRGAYAATVLEQALINALHSQWPRLLRAARPEGPCANPLPYTWLGRSSSAPKGASRSKLAPASSS